MSEAVAAPGSKGPPVWFSYCRRAASVKLKVTGKVKDWPEATVEGRDELPHWNVGLPVVQLVMETAVFAVQLIESCEVPKTMTEPKAAGFGVHVRGAL